MGRCPRSRLRHDGKFQWARSRQINPYRSGVSSGPPAYIDSFFRATPDFHWTRLPRMRGRASIREIGSVTGRPEYAPFNLPDITPQFPVRPPDRGRAHRETAPGGSTMKAYATQSIRNVGIAGHGDTGKTQLVSSLLFTAGMTPRLGKVDRRKHRHRLGRRRDRAQDHDSHRASPTRNGRPPGKTEKTKINFLDTPGYSTFHQRNARVADGGGRGADRGGRARGRAGGHRKSVGLRDRVRSAARIRDQLDGPRAGEFRSRAWSRCSSVFGRGVVPMQLPIGAEKAFSRRGGPDHDEGADLHAGRRRQSRRSKRFPRTWPKRQRSRTKRWWRWWPKATTR